MSNQLQKSRWSALTPYTIGFDEMFERLDSYSQSDRYPKYNIIQESENKYVIEVALAGYKYSDLEVSTENNVLYVGTVSSFSDDRKYLYKGIAKRSFVRTWQLGLGDDLRVIDVKFTDGLLLIYLEKNIPEHKKKVVWELNSSESETKCL